jgi:aminoglycoside phosphotransferase family enzyme/predicted kinase
MTPADLPGQQASLIAALRSRGCYAHPVGLIRVLETHISWVVLTGDYAYKIKKPVNLGFLDFTDLESRRHYCEEELRLNRRLAPALYEAMVKITGSTRNPRIEGDGPAMEYAIRMREFPQRALASGLLADGHLTHAHIDQLATRIAAFHAAAGVATQNSRYGTPDAIIAPARENFAHLQRLMRDAPDQARMDWLQQWTEREYAARRPQFAARRAAGQVRECHGDLHLGNIVMLDDQLTPFDCIEFNAEFRWIDVMGEIAFLVMDLLDHGRIDFAYHFLNAYLEAGGGYDGLGVLRFYLVYRAMVRAKVHALRSAQSGIPVTEHHRLVAASRDYLELARRCAQGAHAARPAFILMHGLSGSGKSIIAQALAEKAGAIRLRSDVERKRMGGLAPLDHSGSALQSGIYTADITWATYHRLLDLACGVANAGHAAVIDATFLKQWQRDLFRHEAQARRIPFGIVDVTAPEAVLRARIASRRDTRGDPSEADQAVLTQQLAQNEVLSTTDDALVVCIDTAQSDIQATMHQACEALGTLLVPPEPENLNTA